MKYASVSGFGGIGLLNGVVQPSFGWRDIWAVKAGARIQASPTMDVRIGYAYAQSPLQEDQILVSTGAPATFQNHITAGAGIKVFPFLTLEASFYYVPREQVDGFYVIDQFTIPKPAVPGTMNINNQLTSALIGLNFKF